MTSMTMMAAAAAVALLAGTPAAADAARTSQDLAGFAKPSNEARRLHVEALLKARGIPYEVVAFEGGVKDKPERGHNVVVTFGKGPREIILSAHLDAVRLKDGKMVDGMIDNAGSALALVQAAETLKGRTFRHTVRVIFFDQEELGLIGSREYLKTRKASDIAAAVNFDVNGNGDTVMFGLPDGKESVSTQALRRVCAARTLDCLSFPKYPPSDDLSFKAAGIPVVSIAQQPAKDAHLMWLEVNEGKESGLAEGVLPSVFEIIHSPKDTMAVVEPAAVERAAAIAVDMVADLDRTLP